MTRHPRDGVTLVLGTFDGMHQGHATLMERARAIGGYSLLHTFLTHPRAVVTGNAIPLLSTAEERVCQAVRMGVDEMRMIRFTKEIAALPPQGYLRYLTETLRPRHIVVGFNHTFGKKSAGDAAFLRAQASHYGYTLHAVPPFKLGGEVVGATAIRSRVAKGEMERAAHLLGRFYSVGGYVVHGRHLGNTLGFPTANIHPPNKLLPPFGVYNAFVELRTGFYESVLNIGMRPTVGGHHITIEAHLLDFEGDIYGKYARAHLLHFQRPEAKFDGKEALSARIAADVADARAFFEKKRNIIAEKL